MNTNNYDQFGRARSTTQSARFETHTFTLDPSETGFYVALQDTGTCVGISRLRVYRYNCPSRQVGLVLYPETPAPVSGSVTINVKCVDNAVASGSTQVTCHSNGTWGPDTSQCECSLGFANITENMVPKCVGKSLNVILMYSVTQIFSLIYHSIIHAACPVGQYRSLYDRTCQQCPVNTLGTQPAASVCECLDGYFRYKADVNRPSVPGIIWSTSDERPSVGCSCESTFVF